MYGGDYWASTRAGETWLVKDIHYAAICAKPGNSAIRKDYLSACQSYSLLCGASNEFGAYTVQCVRDAMKPLMSDICRGGNYSLMATKGELAYNGYSGSIAYVSDNQDGYCAAMCNT